MTRFRVWAPRARERVELEIGGSIEPMERTGGDWWIAEVSAGAGDDYAFRVDGAGPLPDPRSPCQPHGVHGPSRRVDHGAFRWSDDGWNAPPLASAVLYELHVGTFTPAGTFEAVASRLDHLVELGVTHVELMPVAAFPGERGWGYDGVHLFAPHPAYGSPEELAGLVDACHARGLAVIADVVYNHLGPDGNHLAKFGPYFTDRYRTPWGEAVNLDGPDSSEVRRFFVDNALHWLESYHFDGLRLDAVHALRDRSDPPFLEELALAVEGLAARLGRRLVIVAESDANDPRLVEAREVGGRGLDAVWNDDFHHGLHALLTGERQGYYLDFGGTDPLARTLTEGFAYTGQHSRFRGHPHGRPVGDLPGHRFVGYLQNHDQVGNRARGERIGQLVSPGLARVGAALALTAPFVPMLFQGEEWAASSPFLYFSDHRNPEVAEATREGRFEEFRSFGWTRDEVPDPQSESTFLRSKIDWAERHEEPHASMLEWYRDLLRLRRTRSELTDGRLDRVEVDRSDDAGWLVMRRGALAVAANVAPEPRTVPLGAPAHRLLLASHPDVELRERDIALPAESVAIVELARRR